MSELKIRLEVKVPNLLPENAKVIVRDIRHTLENCAKLDLLDEFIETQIMEAN